MPNSACRSIVQVRSWRKPFHPDTSVPSAPWSTSNDLLLTGMTLLQEQDSDTPTQHIAVNPEGTSNIGECTQTGSGTQQHMRRSKLKREITEHTKTGHNRRSKGGAPHRPRSSDGVCKKVPVTSRTRLAKRLVRLIARGSTTPTGSLIRCPPQTALFYPNAPQHALRVAPLEMILPTGGCRTSRPTNTRNAKREKQGKMRRQ